MAVQVISPLDWIENHFTSRQAPFSPLVKYPPKSKPYPNNHNHKPNPNPNPNPKQVVCAQPDRQKQRKPSRPNNTSSLQARSTPQKHAAANDQLSSQVKILKRGEELTRPVARHQLSPPPKRNHPSPQKVQELRLFAGSCTSGASPSPRSLPIPSFLTKNKVVSDNEEVLGVTKASTA